MSLPAKTILLVEDEAIIAMDEAAQLKREGFNVITVSSGREAIDRVDASSKSIDFILMDIDLGRGMDGTEAAQEILKSHDIPVMFLSSHTEREIVDRTEKITSYGYVVKNSGITVLAASIRMAFRLHEANRKILEQKMEIEAANEEMQAANEELEATNQELMNYQEDLRASETRYHDLFSAMNDGVSIHELVCDDRGAPVDYRIVDVNGRYTELTGIERDAAVGLLGSQVYGTGVPPFLKEFSEVALTGKPCTIQVYHEPIKKHFLITMFSPGPSKFVCVFQDVTPRMLMMEKLEASEKKYRTLVESIPSRIFIKDVAGVYVSCNENYARDLNIAPDGIAGKTDFDFHPGKLAERYRADDRRIMETGRAEEFDEIYMAGGRELFIHVVKTPIRDDGGRVTALLGIFQDVSEKKRIEAELRRTERRLNDILDNLDTCIFTKDTEYRYTYANRRVCDLFGKEAAEIYGKTDGAFFSRESVDEIMQSDRYVIERGETVARHEKGLIASDGIVRTYWVVKLPLRDESGRITGLCGISTDITDRLTAQEEAMRERDFNRDALDSLPGIFYLFDEKGRFLRWNRNVAAISGYADEEIAAMNLLDFFSGRYRDTIAEGLKKVLEAGETVVEASFLRRDGSEVPMLYSGKRMLYDGNTCVVGMGIDISKRKAVESELENTLALLEGAFEQSPVPMVLCTMPGAVVRIANTASRIYLGVLDRPMPVGRSMLEYTPTWKDYNPDGTEIPYRDLPLAKAIMGEFTNNMEYYTVTVHGEVHWGIITAGPVYNRAGELIAAFVVFPEITDRKAAERQREAALAAFGESERGFRLLAENSTDIISRHRPDGTYLYVSPACRSILGYEPEEMVGRSAFDFVHPDDLSYLQNERTRVSVGGDAYVSTFRVIRKDGSSLWLESTSHSVRDETSGEIIEIQVSSRDITERKRAEEALESRLVALTRPLEDTESLAFEDLFKLETIQEIQDHFARATGVAVLMTRPDGTAITEPSNFCNLCANIIRKTEKGRINCQISDANLGRFHHEGPVIQQCLSGGLWGAGASISVGGRHIANWLIGQVRNEAQSEESMKEYAREIGADEEEVLGAFHEVPIMPRERFEEIARMLFVFANHLSLMAFQNVQQARSITERRSAETELEKLVMEKETLLKELQHRVKNSLNIVTSLLALEEKNLPDERSRAIFTNTRTRINSMSVVYERLYRAGGVNRVDLGAYIDSLAVSLQSTYMPEDGKVAVEKAIEELWLDVKSVVPLGLIMNELISNALKYAGIKHGKVTIRIVVRRSGDTAELRVEDNGVGLPTGFSVEETQSMGFLLVKMLTQQIDGTLTVDSSPGSGTAVAVRFGV
jgi:PAS domain S-box-containing protein